MRFLAFAFGSGVFGSVLEPVGVLARRSGTCACVVFVGVSPGVRSHSSTSTSASAAEGLSREARLTAGVGVVGVVAEVTIVRFPCWVPSSPMGRWRNALRGVVNSVDSKTGICYVLLSSRVQAIFLV